MIIGVICRDELVELGEFGCMEDAQEVYGEQTELLGFNDRSEFDSFNGVVRDIRDFTRAMEQVAIYTAEMYCDYAMQESD